MNPYQIAVFLVSEYETAKAAQIAEKAELDNRSDEAVDQKFHADVIIIFEKALSANPNNDFLKLMHDGLTQDRRNQKQSVNTVMGFIQGMVNNSTAA